MIDFLGLEILGIFTLDPLDCFLYSLHSRERVMARDGSFCRLLEQLHGGRRQ
jgi:hypothetical protein